jgi:midasin (ATPase involved in ribosome maturation)
MVAFTRSLLGSISEPTVNQHSAQDCKRRRLDSVGTSAVMNLDSFVRLADLVNKIENISKRYHALFEWVDGPLVHAMNHCEMILLDEMSLAEDAVLERLNSVLEPSRTLMLAEIGTSNESESRVIIADPSF